MPRFRDQTYAAFLFDMDGTMLDSSDVVERLWHGWAVRHGVDPDTLLSSVHGVRAADTMRRFGGPDIDLASEVAAFNRSEVEDVAGIVPIAGIHAIIERLAPDDWAIVTSAPRDLALARLGAVGLPVPAIFVTAEDVERGKPDPQGFIKAAELLGVTLRDCLVFEDSPAGVAAARTAGAHVAIVGPLVEARKGELALTDYR